jgi:hypothetical protein
MTMRKSHQDPEGEPKPKKMKRCPPNQEGKWSKKGLKLRRKSLRDQVVDTKWRRRTKRKSLAYQEGGRKIKRRYRYPPEQERVNQSRRR